MEVHEDDVWGAVATSASPPPAISTALSLNTRLHLLAASGSIVGGVGVGRGCFSNLAASPSSSSYCSAAGALHHVLERETCIGPSAAAARWTAANAGGGVVSGSVERRKKRLIKNREAASRSRARRQAHVTQIETEVKELREANEQLRIKYEQRRQLKAMVEVSVPVPVPVQVPVRVPVKKSLKRVLSAPF